MIFFFGLPLIAFPFSLKATPLIHVFVRIIGYLQWTHSLKKRMQNKIFNESRIVFVPDIHYV